MIISKIMGKPISFPMPKDNKINNIKNLNCQPLTDGSVRGNKIDYKA